jgi:hypothetical protein
MNVVEAQNVTCHVDRELMYVRIVVVRKVELTQPLSTQQNSQTSPFLKLPGEIRNRIYHFAFCNMVLRVLPPLGSLSVLMTEQDLAFSTTYRQIYYEATPIFYELAEFRIIDLDKLERFFDCVHARYRSHIRSVTIWWPDFQRKYIPQNQYAGPQIRCQQPFPNLDQIVVRKGGHGRTWREWSAAKDPQIYRKGGEGEEDSKIELVFRN